MRAAAGIEPGRKRHASHHRRATSLARSLAVLIAVFTVLAACSEETQSQIREAAENVDAEELAGTVDDLAEGVGEVSDAVEAGSGDTGGGDVATGGGDDGGDAEAPPPDGGDAPAEDDGLSSEDWILIVLLGLGAFAIIVFATSAATNHADKKAAAATDRSRRLGEVTGDARWLSSSGVNDLLTASDPEQLSVMWASTRSRFVDLESKIAAMAGTTGEASLDQALNSLGQTVAGLRGALRSYVSVRSGPDAAANPAAVQNAAQTVSEQSRQVLAALAPVEGAMR